MKKNLIKIICLSVAFIMCLGIMCACNRNDDNFRNPRNGKPEAGEFYTLRQVYDNGWLSKGDLRNIAYYWAGDGQRKGFKPTPKNPETLSAETELVIRNAYASRYNHEDEEFDTVSDRIVIGKYCGVYNGLIAAYVYDPADIVAMAIKVLTIGDVEFKFPNLSHEILLFEQKEQ